MVAGAANGANQQRCQGFVMVTGDGNCGSSVDVAESINGRLSEVEGTGNGSSPA